MARRRSAEIERIALTDSRAFDAIIEAARERDIALIGEASHGTHEFYQQRAIITRRLIDEAGYSGVAIEGDWPDSYAVDCFVRGRSSAKTANEALAGFRRFPTWMWRNTVVVEFVEWLRRRNAGRPANERAGFYGLDLYSMYTSVDAVLRFLERRDPDEAAIAKERYNCFSYFGTDPQAYGYAAMRRPDMSCEDAAIEQLLSLRRQEREYVDGNASSSAEDFFQAEQNARLVKNAEEYYRTMYRGGASSWNLRDRHMCETLYALLEHSREKGNATPRIVVWAHNSHLGDARATSMGKWGEWNLGQLARERSGERVVNIGFTTYTGTVTAASDWDEPAELKKVRPGLAGSYERLFHEIGGGEDFVVDLRATGVRNSLEAPLLERAIGVIYRPETERQSHYFTADLAAQFDFVIHVDRSSALVPLEAGDGWHGGEPPEAYPSGM